MAKGKQVFDPLDAALVRTDEEEWIQSGDGNQFKVLRISKETGAWSALIKADKGQVNPPHTPSGRGRFLRHLRGIRLPGRVRPDRGLGL